MDALAERAAAARLARVDTGVVTTLVDRLRVMVQHLREAADGLGALVTAGSLLGWSGAGYDAFARSAAASRARLVHLGDALEVAASALASLREALIGVQHELRAATRVLAVAGPTDPGREVASALGSALSAFEEADARAAFLLSEALLLDLTHASALPVRAAPLLGAQALAHQVAAMPAVPGGAPAVAVWWAGLTVAARASLTTGWPGWAAGIDGIPAAARDQVNRARLMAAVRDAGRAYARAPLYDTYAHEAARTRLLRLKALAAAVSARGSQILQFDASGDGQAVVATADVETSRSVAVVVPGMTNDLGDAPELIGETRRLAASAGPGTSAVMWLGYDAPDVHQAVSDGAAKSGAGPLARFVAGLRSTASVPQHITVIGHSYGTLVAGIAAKRGLGADELVLLASPGVEAAHASELRLPAGHVWVARVPTDPIRLVFWPPRLGWLVGLELPTVFGPDPAAASFGARHFPAGGAVGHSGYFDAGTQSLASLGRIVSTGVVP